MYKDLSGQRIEGTRLTVIRRAKDYVSPKGARRIVWLCRCDCGTEVMVLGDHLKARHVVSCGCVKSERAQQRAKYLIKARWAKRDAASSAASVRTGDTFPSRERQDGGPV